MNNATTINGRRLFNISYRTSPRARRVCTIQQWHESADAAATLMLVKDHNPEAVCVAVTPAQ